MGATAPQFAACDMSANSHYQYVVTKGGLLLKVNLTAGVVVPTVTTVAPVTLPALCGCFCH